MRKQNIESAAFEVATQVRAVEDSIDCALAEIAELQSRIMHANAVAQVSFGTAHPVLQQVAAAVTGLVEARGSVVGCHAALTDAKDKVPGLRTVAFGDVEPCPKTAASPLRVVA